LTVQRLIWKLSLLALLLGLTQACKKKREFNEETGQVTVDSRLVMAENDEVIKEINTVIIEQFLLRGRTSGSTKEAAGSPVCGAKLDTTRVVSGIMTINYDGTNCFGRVRTGSVRFSIQGYPLKKWKQPGTVINIEFIDYKAKRLSDQRIVQFSGSERMTNESGNTWFELFYMFHPSVVYTVAGENIQVTFDENDLSILNVNRRMTYTHSDNVTTCRVEGLGSALDMQQVEHWGQGRDGIEYASRISSPNTWKTSCGAVALLSGETVIKLDGREYELKNTYGLDQSGNAFSSGCPYGWEVNWSRKSKTKSRLFGYY
jgi:hypothetical protein